jgi:NAD-dependent deacetylase
MPHPAPISIASELGKTLSAARFVTVLSGAGISAESGVPTFRDAQTGIWARFDPRELATPSAFERHPKLVWDWYASRRKLAFTAQPNAGHYALAAWERCVAQFLLITQNVDGLHRRSGSEKIVELHGNIARVKCSREGNVVSDWDECSDEVPRCANCGALLRPDVVWFEEMLPPGALAQAEAAARRCDVMLVVGTSAEVYPAAALPAAAKRAGATIVEVNTSTTALSALADYVLRGRAALVLPALLAAAHPVDNA